jgi:hypothetical protein
MKRWFFILLLVTGCSKIPGGSAAHQLSAEDLAWGETQVAQLLKDRPAMVPYVRKGDTLWTWTVRQFAGEYLGSRIRWDAKDPQPICNAFFYGPENGKKAYIQVTSKMFASENYHYGEPKTAPVLWYETANALSNMRLIPEINKIQGRAEKGSLDREGYIRERILAARRPMQWAHDFFVDIWVPQCKALSLPPEDSFLETLYGAGVPVPSKKETLKLLFVPGNLHYAHYANIYDWHIGAKAGKEKTVVK